MTPDVYLMRLKPSDIDRVQEGLDSNTIMIGWELLPELLDPSKANTKRDFRDLIHSMYHEDDANHKHSGKSAGEAWRFIREMSIGDIVVTPHLGTYFYVGRVTGKVEDWRDKDPPHDTAFRRPVEWLNSKRRIKKERAGPGLRRLLRSPGICCRPSADVASEIDDCLRS